MLHSNPPELPVRGFFPLVLATEITRNVLKLNNGKNWLLHWNFIVQSQQLACFHGSFLPLGKDSFKIAEQCQLKLISTHFNLRGQGGGITVIPMLL